MSFFINDYKLLLELLKVSKFYDEKKILEEISFQVNKGECLTIFGPNGSGKTTLLDILSSNAAYDEGIIKVFGHKRPIDDLIINPKIGFLGHQTMLHPALTVEENLMFFAKLYRVNLPKERILELLSEFSLQHLRSIKISELSHGHQKLIGFVRVLLNEPELLLLDEPETGLDARFLDILKNFIEKFKKDKTIIITSHSFNLGVFWSDRLAILFKSKLTLYQNSVKELPKFKNNFQSVFGVLD